MISKDKQEELYAAARPIIKWLEENVCDYVKVEITHDRVTVLDTLCSCPKALIEPTVADEISSEDAEFVRNNF